MSKTSKTGLVVRQLWQLLMNVETVLVGVPKGHTGQRRIRKWRRGRKKLLRLDQDARRAGAAAVRQMVRLAEGLSSDPKTSLPDPAAP